MFDHETKGGSLRLMTLGEIKMAKEIFREWSCLLENKQAMYSV